MITPDVGYSFINYCIFGGHLRILLNWSHFCGSLRRKSATTREALSVVNIKITYSIKIDHHVSLPASANSNPCNIESSWKNDGKGISEMHGSQPNANRTQQALTEPSCILLWVGNGRAKCCTSHADSSDPRNERCFCWNRNWDAEVVRWSGLSRVAERRRGGGGGKMESGVGKVRRRFCINDSRRWELCCRARPCEEDIHWDRHAAWNRKNKRKKRS